jgi:type II secretory pathway component GspD/PulD (secretin)
LLRRLLFCCFVLSLCGVASWQLGLASAPASIPPAAKPATTPAPPPPAAASPSAAKPAATPAPPPPPPAAVSTPATAPPTAPAPAAKPAEPKQEKKPAEAKAEAKPAAAEPKAAAPAETKPAAPQPKPAEAKPIETSKPAPASEPPEPLLRFNYRFQRWVDVLEEIAKQAGLSLVLEAPPPGTFNYSDPRDYTPTEAIDLVNGVLLTKGFTLVHREKMLVLIDLSEGIPEGLIPRVTMEELAKRGKFEMVSVLFALKGRDAAKVSDEIKPLLGPHGKIVPLPSTGQLLLTDTAGVMKAVGAVIESMPISAAAAASAKAAETAALSVYPVKTADPQTVLKVLQTLLPGAAFALDPKTDQIHAYAGPTQQATVKSVLEQIQTNAPADKKPRLESYTVGEAATTELLKTLTAIVPDAKLAADPKTGGLVAWAAPGDQQTIRTIVEKVGGGSGGPEQARQFEVYRLTKADPTTTSTLLQDLLPRAKIAVDKPAGSLVVIGAAAEQKAVRAILDQLQMEKAGPGTPVLKAYPVTTADAAGALATLKVLYPNVQIVLDAKAQRFLVTAAAADQTVIQASLEQIQAPAPAEKRPRFESYLLHGVDASTLVANLQTLLPEAKVTVDRAAGKLVVFGTPAEHEAVKGALEKLGRGTSLENTPQVEVYRLTKVDPKTVLATLQPLVPEAKLTLDPQSSSLVAVAVPADQKLIHALVEQLQPEKLTPDKQPRLDVYAVQGTDPTALATSLQSLVPNAKITADAKTGKLVVWGTPEEHQTLKAALEKLGRGPGVEGTPQLEVYRLTKADPATVTTTLASVAPEAKLTIDSASKSLIVLAVPADQKAIRNVLEQLQSEKPAADAPQLRFYPLSQPPSSAMVSVLQALAPKAQVTLDPVGRRLTVVASPEDHAALRAAIEQVDKTLQAEEQRRLVTYFVTPSQRKRFQAVANQLTTELPGIQVVPATEPGELVIWARPSQHVVIADLLEQLKRDLPAAERYELAAYPIKTADPTGVLSALKVMFPNAQFTPEPRLRRLIVWALPADQEAIRAAIEKIDAARPGQTQENLIVYPLADLDPPTAIKTLQDTLPDVKLSSDPKAGTLLAWAMPWEHETIDKILKQLQAGAEAQGKPKLVVYPVSEGDPAAMATVLRALVSKAQVAVDDKTHSIAATATPQEHELIRAAVEQMSKKETPETARKMAVYSLKSASPTAAYYTGVLLRSMFPDAQFSTGAESDKMVVWARPKEHEAIKSAVEQLSRPESPETARQMKVYTLESAGPGGATGAITTLSSMFPDAQFTAGAAPDKVVAWARAADHKLIAQAVHELSKAEPPETARKMVVYSLKSASPSAAYYTGVLLRSMFPDAQFSTGAESDKMVVWARPKEHEAIKSAVEQLSRPEPAETARQMKVYTLESAGPGGATGAITTLSSMFPDAQFTAGAAPGKIVAWARAGDHKLIAQAVAEMSKQEPPEKARKMAAYWLESGGPYGLTYALTVLRAAFPDAEFSVGADPNHLFAWARPAEHEAIKSAVDEMSKKAPPGKTSSVATYRLEAIDAATAAGLLRSAFAEAQFSPGTDPSNLIVWARPTDQALIKQTIDRIEAAGGPNDKRVLSVHPFKSSDVTAFTQLLDPALRRGVQLVPDPTRGRLLVWADPKHQAAVKGVIEQFARETAQAGEPVSQVYRFERADPSAAYTVLSTLVPNAQIALDTASRSLVVSAMPPDHAKIKATIEEMDRRDAKGQALRVEVHRLKWADPANLMPVLQGLFRLHPDVQLSLDDKNDAIVALAAPAQHETIRALVEQVEKQAAADSAVRLEIYPLGENEPASTLRTLTGLLEKQGTKAQLSIEPRSNSLVAIARPEQHKAIRAALDQLKPEERTLEVIPLENVEVATAEMAIERMFNDDLYGRSGHAPTVDADETTQQLIVRATGPQHQKIRDLLVRLGETGLSPLSGTDARRSRLVPFDGDAGAAVEEIKRVWPQLRSNPIRVVTPRAEVILRRRPTGKEGEPGEKPNRPAPDRPPAAGKPPLELDPPPAPDAQSKAPAAKASASPENKSPRPAELPAADRGGGPATPAAKGQAGDAAKPVIVVPGEGGVTITSDDPAALAQFEALLRALSRQRGAIGRNYNIFLLRNAKASAVATTLQQVFRTLPGTYRGPGSVVVVPDDRLNAIVAYANRTDRATIESLLKVLDTAELPDSLSAERLRLIPIKNTSAEKIMQTLTTMFRSQVEGFSVEDTTNSVVVMAAPQTVEEIKRVANMLDEAAGSESSRSVEVVPLRKVKSDQVEKALDVILRSRSRR